VIVVLSSILRDRTIATMSDTKDNDTCRRAILTQDSPPPSPNSSGSPHILSFNEAVDLFIAPGDLSPNSSAKIMAPMFKEHAKTANFDSISPDRKRLFLRQEAISDKMPYLSPATKRKLETLTAASYIKRRQCFNSTNIRDVAIREPAEAKRKINFALEHTELVAEQPAISKGKCDSVENKIDTNIVEPELETNDVNRIPAIRNFY